MAKLILSLDGAIVREIVLDKDPMTIGRRPTSDVHIDHLSVSAEHARIVTVLGERVLEDLGSTNGTLINGARITKHILQADDLIALGIYRLKFIDEPRVPQPSAPVAEDDFEKTMVVQRGAGAPRRAARPVAPPPAPAGMLDKLKSWFRSWFT